MARFLELLVIRATVSFGVRLIELGSFREGSPGPRRFRADSPTRPLDARQVNDGDLVTLQPCDPESLAVGDIVLVRVRGTDYLHLVKAIDRGRFLIGNNRGGTNGWVGRHTIYGKATRVER